MSEIKIYMTRCPKCSLENYVLSVTQGTCCWCGYEATTDDVNGRTVWIATRKTEESEA